MLLKRFIITRMYSSRMCTAGSLSYRGVSMTETSLDRNPPGQRPPGQKTPRQRAPGQRPPRQRPPGQRLPGTETPPGQRQRPPMKRMTDWCKNITFANSLAGGKNVCESFLFTASLRRNDNDSVVTKSFFQVCLQTIKYPLMYKSQNIVAFKKTLLYCIT